MNQENNQQLPTKNKMIAKETYPGENHLANLTGYIRTVDTAPTYTPKTFFQGLVLYANGATYRLYIYDFVNKAWRYLALT